jgi:nitrogenase molybdenum-iron protein alpha/beta subunit
VNVKDPTDRTELEDFALKGLQLAKMTGVCLATHAIPDAFLMMHTGVGCKYKTSAQIANHDWGSHPNRREAWTQVAELQLIKGSSVRIGPFVRAWYERRRPEFMAVVSAYFIELTGEDFSDAVVAAEKTVPCDIALLSTAAPNGGFFEGYAAVMLEIAERQDWKVAHERPGVATAIGSFFTRYEPDHLADVAQLQRLCKVAGLELGPVMFSGQPYTELKHASKSEYVLQLPYAKPVARKLKRLFRKRKSATLDLPMGLAGTRRFVRELTELAGGATERTETWIEAQEKAVLQHVNKLTDHLRHTAVAIFADTPLAAGLFTMLHELEIAIPLVGLRDPFSSLGGKLTFLEILERNGITELPETEILVSPSLRRVQERSMDLVRQRRVQCIIASSHEINVLERKTAAVTHPIVLIETGFPSDRYHTTSPSPSLGYDGIACWSQRILNAVNAPRIAKPSALD